MDRDIDSVRDSDVVTVKESDGDWDIVAVKDPEKLIEIEYVLVDGAVLVPS